MTLSSTKPLAHAPVTWISRSIGPYRSAFSSTFSTARSSITESTYAAGSSGLTSSTISRSAVNGSRRCVAARTRSTSDTATGSGASPPARIRVSSSAAVTSCSRRETSRYDASSRSCRSSGAIESPDARSAALAALIVASGVRRSWVIAARKLARERSTSAATRCSRASASSRARSNAALSPASSALRVASSYGCSGRPYRTLSACGASPFAKFRRLEIEELDELGARRVGNGVGIGAGE